MVKIIFRLFPLLFFLGSPSIPTYSQVLEDYEENWKEGERETWFSSNDRLVVDLDTDLFPLAYFTFEFPAKSVVLVGGKPWFLTKQDTIFTVKVDAFQEMFGSGDSHLIVFRQGIMLGDAKVKKVVKPEHHLHGNVGMDEISVQDQKKTDKQEIRDFFITALIVTLFLLALYKLAYPYLFTVMVQPLALFSADDFSESGNLQKFFSLDILFYVLLVNLFVSLSGVLGLVFFRREWMEERIGLDYESLLFVWLLAAVVLMILTVFKFIAVKVIAYLFELGKLEFPHFFYLLRLIAFTTCTLLLVTAIYLMNDFSKVVKVLSYSYSAFFWLYIAGIASLFLIMMNRLSFKKYHLFTYLCIAELVPFLILAKWITVMGQ